MVGDNLETDIRFAQNCGIDSLLVLSGVTHEPHAKKVILGKELTELESMPTYV
jgi:ribonucleotide monophosphatase NagD (HAD superfamily)